MTRYNANTYGFCSAVRWNPYTATTLVRPSRYCTTTFFSLKRGTHFLTSQQFVCEQNLYGYIYLSIWVVMVIVNKILPGSCRDLTGILPRSFQDLSRILPGSCQDPGSCLDLPWILPRSFQDLAGILPKSFQDLAWILLGSCQDLAKILLRSF